MAQRSWLFVPGDSPAKMAKIPDCGADCVIIDLEDSVAETNKALARGLTQDFLAAFPIGTPKLFVRVNALSTGLTADDLNAAISPATTGIMLPKAEGGASVGELAAMLRVAEARAGLKDGVTKIIAIATETARGVLNAGTYDGASHRLQALAWGAEDLSADIGAHSARDSDGNFTPLFAYARTVVLLGAASAGVSAIDGIYADFRDVAGLGEECAKAFRDGFTGKMAIHPAQIETINRAFTPSDAALAHARAVVDAFTAAGNSGVISLNGQMLDRPHLRLAERLVGQADTSKLP